MSELTSSSMESSLYLLVGVLLFLELRLPGQQHINHGDRKQNVLVDHLGNSG